MGDKSSGPGFARWLQLLFIGLKLSNQIDWSWWYVMLPTIIALVLIFIIAVVEVIEERKYHG